MSWASRVAAGAGPIVPDAATSLIEAGRTMYREGRLASGQPMTATVQGDVPVLGSQFSCQNCHGRSGMGLGEGVLRVPAVAASLLFEPDRQRSRPAYTEADLARALRLGVDPAGRGLDPLMPRYALSDADVAALFAYLRTVAAEIAPGVDDISIRFATIFGDDVPAASRQAVLQVLTAYAEDKNRETRKERVRPEHGVPSGQTRPRSYRSWQLDVWDLSGAADTWRAQLEARYRTAPVFAILGGATARPWTTIHRFCEERAIPCLFPSTDLPEDREGDFYTLYFSRGLLLEADLVAADLAAAGAAGLVQAFRPGSPGERAAIALRDRLRAGGVPVEDQPVPAREGVALEGLAHRLSERAGWAAALWLGSEDLGGLGVLRDAGAGPLYLSATLLDGRLDGLPALGGLSTRVVHPFRLPGHSDPGLQRFRLWRGARRIDAFDERRQAQAFFACVAATDALRHIGRHFFRDYLLDVLDHAQGLTAYVPYYPAPSGGPGQRFVAKGGYLVPLGGDGRPDTAAAVWRLP